MKEEKLGKILHKTTKVDENLVDKMLEKAPFSQNLQYLKKADGLKSVILGISTSKSIQNLAFKTSEHSVGQIEFKTSKQTIDKESKNVQFVKTEAKPRPENKRMERSETDVVKSSSIEAIDISIPKLKKKKKTKKTENKDISALAFEILGEERKKKKAKKKHIKSKEDNAVKSKKSKAKKKKIIKSQVPSNKDNFKENKTDESYSSWLMRISSGTSFETTKIETQKIKKNQKKSKKKDKLKSKIEQSVIRNSGIASETLAKLYLEQGYHDKAIEVYRHLSLKNPKKSSFFADQIKIIKKGIQ